MRKTVLVTGAARGIGKAIAANLAPDHNVAITWNTTSPTNLPENVFATQADLTKAGMPQAVVADTIKQFGGLDIIINNAGSVRPTSKEDFDVDAQREILDVNLLAPGALLSAALPHLKRGAAVINISSMNAVLPPNGAVIYGASKAALDLWTRGMAKELGPQGIRVNAVAPGAINIPEAPRSDELTEIFVKDTALGRIGTPDDIARAVRFLASDAAEFITGEVLTVSGGYRL